MQTPILSLVVGIDGSVTFDNRDSEQDITDPRIAEVVPVASQQEELVDALCTANRHGARAVELAAVCDELDLTEAGSRRVTQSAGIRVSQTQGGWFAERSEQFPYPIAGTKFLGTGRSRAEAVRDLENKSGL